MKEVSDIVLFFGRFHPLVVHFPIGFLFFAFILEVLAQYQKKTLLKSSVPLALFLGFLSALVSCVLGYMLSLSGDYNSDALDKHFWFGIGTTVIAFIAWGLKTKKFKIKIIESSRVHIASLTFVVVLLSITGHYGGNLTHGSDYLTAYLPFGKQEKEKLIPVNSIEEAQVFGHFVNPILQKKCASCHNSEKKKGNLSLENPLSIVKGGKGGAVLVSGSVPESELINRVLLDSEDDKFMPPKGKNPLTNDEIKILEYWIESAMADFEVTVDSIKTEDEVKNIMRKMLKLEEGTTADLVSAPSIPQEVIKELRANGVFVRVLVAESNFLDVSLPSEKENKDEKMHQLFETLLKIKNNIVWLSLPENGIKDDHLKTISQFKHLKKLRLEKNLITDQGVEYLSALNQLESLNLYNNTMVTNKSVEVFSKMENLKKIYVWGTSVKKDDLLNDQQKFKKLPDFVF